MAAGLEVRQWPDTAGTDATDTVAIEQIDGVCRLRAAGLDEAHVRLLMELAGRWPPVLVRKDDHRVVDGAHRVEAARRLGMKVLTVSWFYGTVEDAYVEAVRQNVKHGLPLAYNDRVGAVGQIVGNHPEWSDRRISILCGVSAKTVARVRAGDCVARAGRLNYRVGKDHKKRPVNPDLTRERILCALEREPQRSSRSIASLVGASPETVRNVRKSLQDGTESKYTKPRRDVNPSPATPISSARQRRANRHTLVTLTTDVAFASREDGQEFAVWFDSGSVDSDWRSYLASIPLSRIYEVADEARRRAQYWAEFARAVEDKGHIARRA